MTRNDGRNRGKKSALLLCIVLVLSLLACGCGRPFSFTFSRKGGEELGRTAAQALKKAAEKISVLDSEPAAEEEPQENPLSGGGGWNILLIGSDRRDAGWNGNSDSMVLVSVNTDQAAIKMVSFMRDTYVQIPGSGGGKLNWAYARGGAALLLQTMKANFGVRIDNYAAVDFGSMEAVINTVGGIDIVLNEQEAAYMSSASHAYAAGPNHLSGSEALAYSRIRYVGNADYERTSRQRRILQEIIAKLRVMDNMTRISAATQVLAYLTTDISSERLSWLISNSGELLNYQIITDRVPYDGLYSHHGEDLVPDYPATIERLRNFLN